MEPSSVEGKGASISSNDNLPSTSSSSGSKTSQDTNPEELNCNDCDYTTRNTDDYEGHTLWHSVNTSLDNIYQNCKAIQDKMTAKRINRDKPYACSFCDYRHAQKSNIKKHEMEHKTKDKKCCYCDFKTYKKGELYRHEVAHKENTKYRCPHCNYTTGHRTKIVHHQRIHSPTTKTFKCSFCEFTTIRKLYLETHVLVHTGNYPLRCAVCNHGATCESGLKKHQKTHARKPAKEKLYKCSCCEFSTDNKRYIEVHEKNKHFDAKLEKEVSTWLSNDREDPEDS